MKISAGILPYIVKKNQIYVLLGHMGGPFYSNIKESYGIIKGEIDDYNERIIDGAIREFKEETTELIDKEELEFLGEAMQRKDKKNIIYIIEKYFNFSNWKSNSFPLEWPLNSGNIEYFPEMDNYKWMEINEAKTVIRPKQKVFLEMLENKLKKRID